MDRSSVVVMTNPDGPKVLPHLRLSWGGNLGAPAVEIWSNALNFSVGPEAPTADELQAIAAAAVAPVRQWISSPDSKIGNCVSLNWIKAVWVLNSGKQRDTNTAVKDLVSGEIAYGMMTPVPIWEQSYAITLRTALTRGPGHAGRIYPPVSGPPPENNGTPYAAKDVVDAMTVTFTLMVSGLTAAINQVVDPLTGSQSSNGRKAKLIVVSRQTLTNPLARNTEVTRVVIDRVADIQHRRTNRLQRNEATARAI